ncbi:hypothetical protein HFO32_22140 [Rhizobium leguminosarum]|uniref:hypothetical protein n=1 Tax=Rhizobiaceae TaxID=82115 RepID=UPI000FDCA562|nr:MULTISPECIES: hypothetical protein [Rhizobiaceae]MBY5684826.1 hypothetical protein [Rhizobium leguminosarum]RVL87675.1 hypothetical protein CN140_01720 [Sinorhizobium meliloti]
MAHIRTQVRNAFKALLSAEIGELHVHNESRILRGFQADNWPVILVSVTENTRPSNDPPGLGMRKITRDITVSLRVGERSAFDDPEAKVDDMCIKIEKVLANPVALNIGKLWNYAIAGATAPEIEPISEDMGIVSVIVPVSFTLETLEFNPEQNANA